MRKIAEAIASLEPPADIVCLQEVETQSLRANLADSAAGDGATQLERLMLLLAEALAANGRRFGYVAHYFPAHRYQLRAALPFYTTGLAVLARADLDVAHHNAHAPVDITHRALHPVRRLKQTRICAHVRVRDRAGHEIDVFNTHLSLPTTFSRSFWTRPERLGWGPNQLEEGRNLVAFVEAERRSDRYFVCGDFNALPGSPVYDLLVSHGLRDPFASLYEMGPDELRRWPTAGFLRLRMHLDHVFTGPGLDWLDFDGTQAFGDRTAAFHGLSDHVPMVGRFRVARHSERPRPRAARAHGAHDE